MKKCFYHAYNNADTAQQRRRQQKILIIVLAVFTLFRIFMFMSTPMFGLGDTEYDDLLLARHAQSLAAGRWLGSYSSSTLVKGISFPVFLAVCTKLFIPFLLAAGCTYILSIVSFVYAIKPAVPSAGARSAIYLFLLYSPAMLSSDTGQRLYNLTLIPAGVLFTVSGLIAVFLRKKGSLKDILPWSLMASAGVVFFWYLRDDSVWLLPFILGAILITVIYVWKEKYAWKLKLQKSLLVFMPVLCLAAASLAVSAVNYAAYGVFTTNDRTGTNFAKVISDLQRIEGTEAGETIWITQDVVRKAMDVSPALAESKPQIDSMFSGAWANNGEISGDLIVWTLREAFSSAGYYENAAKANEYFGRVHEELQIGFKEGLLTEKKAVYLSPLSKPLVIEKDMQGLWETMVQDFKMLSDYEASYVRISSGSGNWYQRRFLETMAAGNVVYSDVFIDAKGWIVYKQSHGEKSAVLTDKDGNQVGVLEFYDSADVAGTFPEYGDSAKARFEIQLLGAYQDGVFLNLYEGEELIDTIPFTAGPAENEKYVINLEKVDILEDPNVEKSEDIVRLSNAVIWIYQKMGNILTIAAALSFLILTVYMVLKMKKGNFVYWEQWLITTGLIVSYIVLVAAVSWFTGFLNIESYEPLYHYSVAGITMSELIKILSLCFGVKILCGMLRNKAGLRFERERENDAADEETAELTDAIKDEVSEDE